MSTLLDSYDSVPDNPNATNFPTLWDYLADKRGPQRLPLEVAIPLTAVNVFIFITGLIGNLAVCAVIIKHSSLHTATNYYLFNLAISDLTLLIFGLPNDVSVYWHQYPWTLGEDFCKIRSLISEMATYVSVLTIVAFSTERFMAICHPLHKHAMLELQRVYKIIGIIWLVSCLSAAPFSVYTSVTYLLDPANETLIIEESAFCGMTSQPKNFPLAELSTVIFFLIPMVIISLEYIQMGIKIGTYSEQNGLKGSIHRGSRKPQSQKTIVRMLSVVVVGFFVCWAPFHAQRLLFIYGQESPYYEKINAWMFYITGILYYFSSTLNPILYNVMSKRYRNAFKEVLLGIKEKKSSLRYSSTYRDTHKVSKFLDANRINSKDMQQRRFSDTTILIVPNEKSTLMKPNIVDHNSVSVAKSNCNGKSGPSIVYESEKCHEETKI
ncbi:neuropeptides capa receptor-like [Agrilus planipennis]|uniref:Neuropeptides capa receptor-like n=1 Tax=Agrilus planipennis TaxID=224129 RepID=A0A1W4X324_AGRPL|nr:neuropeptides capa receptor-like [Agrilus planipennis]